MKTRLPSTTVLVSSSQQKVVSNVKNGEINACFFLKMVFIFGLHCGHWVHHWCGLMIAVAAATRRKVDSTLVDGAQRVVAVQTRDW